VIEIPGRETDGGKRCTPVECGTASAGPPISLGRGLLPAVPAASGERLIEPSSSWFPQRLIESSSS